MPTLVGLALNEQLLPAGEPVPTDSTDWPIDGLIAGDGRIIRREG
jgi:5-formyltetrahydrofolate cyclo-ligase